MAKRSRQMWAWRVRRGLKGLIWEREKPFTMTGITLEYIEHTGLRHGSMMSDWAVLERRKRGF